MLFPVPLKCYNTFTNQTDEETEELEGQESI